MCLGLNSYRCQRAESCEEIKSSQVNILKHPIGSLRGSGQGSRTDSSSEGVRPVHTALAGHLASAKAAPWTPAHLRTPRSMGQRRDAAVEEGKGLRQKF